LPKEYLEIKRLIDKLMNKILNELRERDVSIEEVKIKSLISLQNTLAKEKRFEEASLIASLIKLYHLSYLLLSHDPKLFEEYLNEILLDDSPSSIFLIESEEFRKIYEMSSSIGYNHPKVNKLVEILEKNVNKTFIVFVQFRNTAKILKEILQEKGINVEIFAGQREMSQKKH